MKSKMWVISILLIIIFVIVLIGKRENKIILNDKDYSSSYSKLAINILKNKANDRSITNYNDGNKHEMYMFNHEKTYYLSENTDYRYIGDNPNNYVYFNCSDISDTSTCELWRIIGIFPLSNSGLDNIKIIRNDSIGEYAYDKNGTTDWGRATLKDYLNTDYYNSISDSAKEMLSFFLAIE